MRGVTVRVELLRAFSADRRVWRAYGFLLAARAGAFLAVPVARVDGDLRQVIDGCPLPWQEVWAAIDEPFEDAPLLQALTPDVTSCAALLASVCPHGWRVDRVHPTPPAGGEYLRLTQDASGVRLCEATVRC